MPFSNPIIGGGGALVYPSIKSPNYVPSTSGWIVKKDGSAEFNNLTIRGTFLGFNYIINNLGAFFYSGTPALGNLIVSIAAAAGANDGLGNPFKAGVTVYGTIPTGGFQRYIEMLATSIPGIVISTGDSSETAAALFESAIIRPGAANRQLETLLSGAASTGGRTPEVAFFSDSADGTLGLSMSFIAGASILSVGEDNTTNHNTTFHVGGNVKNAAGNGTLINYTAVDGILANSGILTAFNPASPGNTESPHTATLLNSWTGTLKYRLEGDNNTVRIYGLLTVPAGVANPSTIFTMPSGYLPVTINQPIPATENGASPFAGNAKICEVTTAGTLHVYDAIAGETLRIMGSYPLDF